jgi:transposase
VLSLPPSVSILLAAGPTDMRNSIDGLTGIVKSQFHEDVFSGALFAFVSRRGDRVKLLSWDRGGFVLYYKRLEQGRFRMPAVEPDALGVQLDSTQLAMLLDGIDYSHVRRPKKWAPPEGDRQTVGSLIKPERWKRLPRIIAAPTGKKRRRSAKRWRSSAARARGRRRLSRR